MSYINEHNIFLFLVQIFIILGFCSLLREAFRKWKQPALVAEIIVGIILGPTIFGRFLPHFYQAIFPADILQQNMFLTVTWLGIFLFLLEVGLEVDFSSLWKLKRSAFMIALSQVALPMVIAFFPALLLPDQYLPSPNHRLIFAIFVATAMSISAMPVAARALQDAGILTKPIGALIMAAVSINDIIGWLVFTLILGVFAQGNLNLWKTVIVLSATTGFTVFCLTVGRSCVSKVLSEIRVKKLPETLPLTFICLMGALCGAVTQKIGMHAIFGFFIAGIMAGEIKKVSRRGKMIISQFVHAVFLPLFFAGIGLRIDFFKNFDIPLVIFICSIGIGGRFLGAWIGAALAKQPRRDRETIAITHIAGGTMEIVVGMLALEYGLIKEPLFIAIVFGAVLSSIIMAPWLSHFVRVNHYLAAD